MKTFLRVSLSLLLPLAGSPIPTATAAPKPKEQTKTLAESFSSQEQPIIEYFLKHAPPMAGKPDHWTKKLKAAKTSPKLLAEFRVLLKDTVNLEIKKDPTDELTKFENFYAESRAKQAKKTTEFKKLLATGKGDKKPDIVKAVRSLIRKDLTVYAADQKKPVEESFVAWLGTYDTNTDLAKAVSSAQAVLSGTYGSPGTPKKSDKAPAEYKCSKDYADTFKDPVECAVIEALLDKEGSGIESKELKKKPEEARKWIQKWLGYYLATEGFKNIDEGKLQPPELKTLKDDYFKGKGITAKSLLKSYCERRYPDGIGGVAAGDKKKPIARKQLDKAGDNAQASVKAADIEGAKSKSSEVMDGSASVDDTMANQCQTYFSKDKGGKPIDQGEFDSTTPGSGTAGNLANNESLAPHGEITDDVPAPTPEEPKKFPTKQVVIGAGVGAIGFAVIGFLLGGPIGMLMGAAIGAAFMGGISFLNNGGYDYLTGK